MTICLLKLSIFNIPVLCSFTHRSNTANAIELQVTACEKLCCVATVEYFYVNV